MAIHAMQGLMGAGKSAVAVNKFLRDVLENTSRHIYTNLPLRWVGEEKHGEVVRQADGSYLNTRTGVPAELLQIVADAVRGQGKRMAMMARIHFLRPGERVPTGDDGQPLTYVPLDEEGNPVAGAVPETLGPKHGVREFWYFTGPNAVVFLDEVADIWPTEDRKSRPESMKSYIRHHRHYKDDLYFFFQDKEDIDPDLRRKIQYLWTVRNSTKENMIDHWATRGIRWPVQFFIVKCYMGREVVGLSEEAMKRRTPQENWTFWPWKSTFRTYWSFSEASTLPGKKAASAAARSTDLDPSLWGKVRTWVEHAGGLFAIIGGTAMLLWLGYRFVWSLVGMSTTDISGHQKADPKAASSAPAAASAKAIAETPSETTGHVKQLAGTTSTNQVERVVLATPRQLVTTKATYEIGDELGGGRIVRVLLNGVELEGGRQVRFRDLLLPGDGRPGGGRGGGGRGVLRGERPDPGRGRIAESQRPAGSDQP